VMTKSCALSSAAILGMSFPQAISHRAGKDVAEQVSQLFYETSSLKEGLLAASLNTDELVVSAMHDVTEGGVLGAVYEMATAANQGVIIEENQLKTEHVVCELFKVFELNPHYCIGAGAMLIAVKEKKVNALISKLQENNIQARAIGKFLPKEKGISTVDVEGRIKEINYPENDPYWAAFFEAIKKGWK